MTKSALAIGKPPYRVGRARLQNGLKLVTVETPHLHSATLCLYVRAGSRYETPETNGISHFLEHMLFRGSSRYPSSFALNLAIEELGGTLYAETGRDYSLYQISLHPKQLQRGMEILGDLTDRFARANHAQNLKFPVGQDFVNRAPSIRAQIGSEFLG